MTSLKDRYSFLCENYIDIQNGTFVLTEDSKDKMKEETDKYLEDAKKLVEDYRKSTNKAKFRQKIISFILIGSSFFFGISISNGASMFMKTKERILSIILYLTSFILSMVNNKKLTNEFEDLKKIKSKLNSLKRSTNDPEQIEKIDNMIDKINKILNSGFKQVKEESVDLENLVNESYEQIIVFEESVHNLFMEQALKEHNAIVTENSTLLNEAEEEFKTKLINFLKTAWNEFVNFINKAIATISSLQVKIHSMFLSKDKREKIEKFVKHNNDLSNKTYFDGMLKKANIESRQLYRIVAWERLNSGIESIKRLTESSLIDRIDELNDVIDSLKDFRGVQPIVYRDTKGNLNREGSNATFILDACFNVFEKRKSWIDDLKRLKDNGMKQYRIDLKNIQDGKLKSQDKLNISNIRRAVNSIVFAINYMTIDAIKIMRLFDRISDEKQRQYHNSGNNNTGNYEDNKKKEYEEIKSKKPPEPEVDKSDESKWTDNGVRKYSGNEYVNLANDEKEWLDYVRMIIKSDYTDREEMKALRKKVIKMGYTNESYLGF